MSSERESSSSGLWSHLKRDFTEAFSDEMLSPRNPLDAQSNDEWMHHRRRSAYRYILIVLACVLATVFLFNLSVEAWWMAVCTSSLCVAIIIDIVVLSRGRRALIPPLVLLGVIVTLTALACYRDQPYSLFLLFPLLVLMPVLLSLRWSALLALGAVCALVPWLIEQYQLAAFMVVLAFAVTWLISTWLMFAIREQGRRLTGMAITDPLTGAYNRRYLELQAERAVEAWQRYKRPVTLLLIDIDHFKRINDEFGHAVGDDILRELVMRIDARIRVADAICRVGGEEFVLLLKEAAIDQAVTVAKDLCDEMAAAEILPEGELTVSIGVADVALAEDAEHWLKLADKALYSAKNNGRNRIEVAQYERPKVVPINRPTRERR